MKKLLLVASALALFGLSGTAFAQPSNDDFDGATVVTEPLPFTDSVSTVDATRAADDPTCSDNDHTVWYSYTASADGFITSNTFGSDYDTTLSVYTGDRGTLTQVACNDDAVGGGVIQSKVTWEAVAATTYHITAGSFSGGEGGNLSLTVQQGEPLLEIEDLSVDPIGRIDPSTRVATIGHGNLLEAGRSRGRRRVAQEGRSSVDPRQFLHSRAMRRGDAVERDSRGRKRELRPRQGPGER